MESDFINVQIHISLKDGTYHKFGETKEVHAADEGLIIVDREDTVFCYPINSISYYKIIKGENNGK